MVKKNCFFNIIYLLIILNISLSSKTEKSTLNHIKNDINTKNRKLVNDEDFKPIRILFDTTSFEKASTGIKDFPKEIFYAIFDKITNAVKKLVRVVPSENPIKLDFSQHPELNDTIVNGSLVEGNKNYDLIIIVDILTQTETDLDSIPILRDETTKRITLGIFNILFRNPLPKNYFHYIEILLLQNIIDFLAFSYESFDLFPIGKENTYVTGKDIYGLDRNYIKTPKVLDFARKYFDCDSITGVPLENQPENNNKARWESRILLGEIMSSYSYNPEQVLSEFTLSLLEDSGWYKVNYYTGGLMKFGKNKGCNFLTQDCSEQFKNEFFNKNNIKAQTCSSGRQSRTYVLTGEVNVPQIYRRYNKTDIGGPPLVEYCLISDHRENEIKANYFSGNCKFGDTDYGEIHPYDIDLSRSQLSSYLNETISDNSFCILGSFNPKNNTYDLTKSIQSLCYEIICSDERITIKIGRQYIVCPETGGKIEINGDYEGYIYCPDYNLICTGTVMCNDVFDCIEKNSLSKDNTYTYNYQKKTNQIIDELFNEPIEDGYEIDERKGICPIDCSQCFEDQCIKCRNDYNLVGTKIGIKDFNCLKKDVSSGYFLYNYVFYPCITNCDKCQNDTLCDKCKYPYYFIEYDRTLCVTGKNLEEFYTPDNGISYFPCNIIPNCKYCHAKNDCYQCITNFYFIKKMDDCVTGIDLTSYFSDDNGILYKYCPDYIANCFTCNSENHCTKCNNNYYFLKENRTYCFTGFNLDEYYSNDNGISYYPCYTHFPNCLKCSNQNTCIECQNGFIFIRKNKNECFTNEEDKTYLDIDGFYYPCYDAFDFCSKCKNKGTCYECFEGYYLVRNKNKNDEPECLKIDISKIYKLSDNTYRLCSDQINNCDECNNPTTCSKCKNGFNFLKDDFTNCRNDFDTKKYYLCDNGISYCPCNEVMNQCNYCSKKDVCDECNKGYYLYKEIKNNCIELDDIEKYYQNGTSYYPCNESIINCNKCFNSESCYDCINGGKIIYEEQNKCYDDSFFEGNNSYYKINDTFYGKCSITFPHCNICQNNLKCDICEENHFFINDNYKECININSIKPEREYYKIDNLNYYTCSYKGVKNCKECQDGSNCYLCNENYALVSLNYSFCHPKSELAIGYYHDDKEIMYYPCLDNCDKCINGIECLNCSENFIFFNDNKVCDVCKINYFNITEDFSNELLKQYTNEYINNNKNVFSNVNVYINEEINLIIIIFRSWYCTSDLLQKNYFEINAEELTKKLSNNLQTSKHFVISYVNYKNKNYIEIFDINKNEQINIKDACPDCLEQNILKINNNFTKEMNLTLGEVIQSKIFEYNINIFNKDDPIFNDICHNFTFDNIDLPIKERREFLFLGNIEKEFLCNDKYCEIDSYFYENLTSFCNCKIQTDINNLFLDNDEISNNNMSKEEYEKYINSKKTINSFVIFKCAKEAFSSNKIKNNANLYITLVFIVIQIGLFVFYILYKAKKQKNSKKSSPKKNKIKSNPPKVEKFSISEDTDENFYTNIKDEKGDLEKEIQEKDKQILYNSIDDDDDDIGDAEKNVQDKDVDSVREKEIENEIINSGGEVTEETLTAKINLFRERRLIKNIGGKNSGSGVDIEGKSSKNNYKFHFKEESSLEGDEGGNINQNGYSKKKSRNKYDVTERKSISSKESFSPSEINNIQNDIIQKTEYINFIEAIKNPTVSFWEYYWKLVQLKQPIINLCSPIKFFKIEESHIPTLVKLMRIILYLFINMFFNILHLNQKYFSNKFNYFNKKYNIRYIFLNEKISSNERFAYGLGHAALSGFISFLICLIIQSILNFFFFNIKKKLANIDKVQLKEENDKKNKQKNSSYKDNILQLMRKEKKRYIIFFSVGFAFMIIIFYLAINFVGVYIGGALDFIAGIFWTFIFLQIIPFIYCLIFSYCRYKGIKDNNEKLFKIWQLIFF